MFEALNRFAESGRCAVDDSLAGRRLNGNEIHDEFCKKPLVYLPRFFRVIRAHYLPGVSGLIVPVEYPPSTVRVSLISLLNDVQGQESSRGSQSFQSTWRRRGQQFPVILPK